ncbi:hypothetical protein [Medusavirus stheno T3]|uniref:Uncharacterized protein n=1 Tax=Medusavirus stheno T3 TaxID=3069717 RepID=A0A7S8BEL8_9VIRU|nr:hypothetical protein QKU73_gp062 [Acanthamoeba castellanii medusavirus]QPB44243.1 hypothetical protein [Medusavirus stheno T3]
MSASPSRKRILAEDEHQPVASAVESPKKRKKSDSCVLPGIDSDLLRRAQELCAAGGIPCHDDNGEIKKKKKKKAKKPEEVEQIKKEKVKAVVTAAVAAALAKNPKKASPAPTPAASKQVQRVVDQFFRRLLKLDEPNRRAISGGQREPSEQEIRFHKKLAAITKSYRTDFVKHFGDELGLDFAAIERDVLGKGVAPARKFVKPAPEPESESEEEEEEDDESDEEEEEEEEEEGAVEPHSSESEESESEEDASGEAESSDEEDEESEESEEEDDA